MKKMAHKFWRGTITYPDIPTMIYRCVCTYVYVCNTYTFNRSTLHIYIYIYTYVYIYICMLSLIPTLHWHTGYRLYSCLIHFTQHMFTPQADWQRRSHEVDWISLVDWKGTSCIWIVQDMGCWRPRVYIWLLQEHLTKFLNHILVKSSVTCGWNYVFFNVVK